MSDAAVPAPARWREALFVAGFALAASPWGGSALGLALGAGLALTVGNPFARSSKWSKTLLQACVVLLGFGMDLGEVLDAGRRGLLVAALSIGLTLAAGAALGRWLGVEKVTSTLIAAGTAICGGSAIAAVATVVGAEPGPIAVSMGTVFVLNAVALYAFPPLGHLIGLTQTQFGTWSGIAIHDVSSVVGAASAYGDVALRTATAVKLSRALWIVPITLLMAWRSERDVTGKIQWPWFIGGFLGASVLRSVFPPVEAVAPVLVTVARSGFAGVLFLVGAGLSTSTLKQVGGRALAQGVLLWLLIGALGLAAALELS